MVDLLTPYFREQLQLKAQCKLEDTPKLLEKLTNGDLLVGGLDISYSTTDSSLAFVGVSVVRIGDPATNTPVSIKYIHVWLNHNYLSSYTVIGVLYIL